MNCCVSITNLLKTAVLFVWAGLLLGISFLEAPLKFQAPGVTLALRLGIGQVVFTALNRVECLLILGLVLAWVVSRVSNDAYDFQSLLLTSLLLAALLIQTFSLRPALNERVVLYHQQITPASSPVHWYYIGLDVLKLLTLLSLSCHRVNRPNAVPAT